MDTPSAWPSRRRATRKPRTSNLASRVQKEITRFSEGGQFTRNGNIEEAKSAQMVIHATRRLELPAGTTEWQGHHYKFFVAPRVSFGEARAACEMLGGHLAYLGGEG